MIVAQLSELLVVVSMCVDAKRGSLISIAYSNTSLTHVKLHATCVVVQSITSKSVKIRSAARFDEMKRRLLAYN